MMKISLTIRMIMLVIVSTGCFVQVQSSRVITTVTRTTITEVNHKIMSGYVDQQEEESEHKHEAEREEQCTDIPSIGRVEDSSLSIPSSSLASDFSVNFIFPQNISTTSEDLPLCLVYASSTSSSAAEQTNKAECGRVVHRKWLSKRHQAPSEMESDRQQHFILSLADEFADYNFPSLIVSRNRTPRMCVAWSHIKKAPSLDTETSVTLRLVQKYDFISDSDDSSAGQTSKRTSAVTGESDASAEKDNTQISVQDQRVGVKGTGLEEERLIATLSATPDDSTLGSVVTNTFQTTSNVAGAVITVYVDSLVDSPSNVSSCNLTSLGGELLSPSVLSGGCNFRSAVETCTLFLSNSSCVDASATSCVVSLPPLQTVIMDPVFGEVMISDDTLCGSLSIEGSGCVIRPSSSTPLSMRLLNVDLPVPSDGLFSLHIDNVVIMNFGGSSIEGGAVRLNNFQSSYFSSVTNVIFRNNSGSDGGALAISNSENMMVTGNVFEGNTAQGDAGGLFIDSDCENINITDCTFIYNTALGLIKNKPDTQGLGGGVMINSRNSLVSLHNCSFYRNVAIRGGGLGVYEWNDLTSLTDVSFSNNTAESVGGGMHVTFNNRYMTLSRCDFLGNIGETDSGGLKLVDGNYQMTLLQCNFIDNRANGDGEYAVGGGMQLGYNNDRVTLQSCFFSGNSANSAGTRGGYARGGGLHLSADNDYFTLQDCDFTGNTANRDGPTDAAGGGLYLTTTNWHLSVQDCHFSGNSANIQGGDAGEATYAYGGAVLLHTYSDFATFENCYFSNNSAYHESDTGSANGGSVHLDVNNHYFELHGCHFSGNSAGSSEGGDAYGGGVYINDDNHDSTLDDCFFSNNRACAQRGNSYGGGMHLASDNYDMTLQDCHFSDNSVASEGGFAEGGGMHASTDNDILTVVDCDFSGNSASSEGGDAYGGGMYIATGNYYFTLRGCDFSDNSVSSERREAAGGGVFMFSDNVHVNILDSYFNDNSADTGGAIHLDAGNWYVTLHNVTCRDNVARDNGGGLALISGNHHLTVNQSHLTGNAADTRGGGIYSAFQNNDLHVIYSEVARNFAGSSGGGLYVGESHKRVYFHGTTIDENIASEIGGGVFFSRFSSDILLSECHIGSNTATAVGALFIMSDFMSIVSSVIENNKARGDYGALYIQNSKSVEITFSNFSNNSAIGSCGAISLSRIENVTISSSLFSDNSAGAGGALCVLDGSEYVLLRKVHCQNNIATASAGALYVINAINIFIETSLFADNTALTGDGSAIYISSSSVSLASSSFSGNKAPLGGGTVFWLPASRMQEPSGLTGAVTSNYFSPSNSARYGSWYGTEAHRVVTENDVSSLEVFDYTSLAAPPITVLIQDWYNQTVLSDSSSSVTVSVSTSVDSDCYGNEGFIGGLTRLYLFNGTATFDFLEPVCAPTYTLQLEVTSSLPSVTTAFPFQYTFRACVTGEYYSDRTCHACGSDSFSFKNPQTVNMSQLTEASTCRSCVWQAESCYKDTIVLREKYWRISSTSTDIYECPYINACSGGNSSGDASCSEGHEGPLCAVCAAGYTFSQATSRCVPCNSGVSLLSFFNVIALIFVLLLLLLIVHSVYTFRVNKAVRDLDDYQLYLCVITGMCTWSDFENNREVLRLYLNNWRSRFEQILKIYIVLFQIVSAIPFVLNLDFPNSYQAMAAVLSFFNLSFSTSSMFSCSANGSFDYLTRLIIDTVYPAALILFLFTVNRIHLYFKTNSETEKIEVTNINARYYSIAIIFTSLILPGISVSIFGVFSCQEYDAENTVPGDDTYMTQDLSISCSSQRYSDMYLYAVLMIFVYPVGIPLSYLYILYRTRRYIMFPNDPLGSKEDEIHRSAVLKATKKLHVFYKPEFWYWEVVEAFYRISLTGLLVLIEPGSSLQILIGFLFAAFFMKIYETASPYVDLEAQRLKTISLYQITGIFCIAILVKGELFSHDFFLSIASVILLTWNIIVYMVKFILTRVALRLQCLRHNNTVLSEISLTECSISRCTDVEKALGDNINEKNVEIKNPLSENLQDIQEEFRE